MKRQNFCMIHPEALLRAHHVMPEHEVASCLLECPPALQSLSVGDGDGVTPTRETQTYWAKD